jgi:putative cobalt transporter subunit CbtB
MYSVYLASLLIGSREIASEQAQTRRRMTMLQAYLPAKTATRDVWTVTGLFLLGMFGLYTLALDQGFLLSLFQGARAFDMNLIHEVLHDTRHAAGFPCH